MPVVYPLVMKTEVAETRERLIRVRTTRRGESVELRVHYEVSSTNGCDTYHLFNIEEMENRTGTD